jgi:hypothetical protein
VELGGGWRRPHDEQGGGFLEHDILEEGDLDDGDVEDRAEVATLVRATGGVGRAAEGRGDGGRWDHRRRRRAAWFLG